MACNCMFNENNPSDHPGVIKITRAGFEPVYIFTDMHYLDDSTRLNVLRNMEKYLTKYVAFKNDYIIEAVNVFPREIKKYFSCGKIPDGMYITKENLFVKEATRILGRKCTSVQKITL